MNWKRVLRGPRGFRLARRPLAGAVAGMLALATCPGPTLAEGRVISFDQCADQYVLALAPRSDIVALSPRARAADSRLRDRAVGLPALRPSAEGLFVLHPDIIVRSWGGDPALVALARRRGVRVVQLQEATSFAQVRDNILTVGDALGAHARAHALADAMSADLAKASGAGGGRPALYLTGAGFTAGRGTFMDAILAAAGFRNAVGASGYFSIPTERLVLSPPERLVLGYFDGSSAQLSLWAPGRTAPLRRIAASRPAVRLSDADIGCPAWYATDAVGALARSASR